MELNQQQIQRAIQDINAVYEMSPKLKIIGGKDMLKQQIVDTVAAAIERQDERNAQLKGETVDVYNILIGAQPDEAEQPDTTTDITAQEPAAVEQPMVETGAEAGPAEKLETQVQNPEEGCFGISYDPNAPECSPEQCGRSAECAETVAAKNAPPATKTDKKAEKEAAKAAKKAEREAKKAEKAAAKNEPKGPSNKQNVFKSWKESNQQKTADVLAAEVQSAVKEGTIKSWIGQWKHGKNLPAGASV